MGNEHIDILREAKEEIDEEKSRKRKRIELEEEKKKKRRKIERENERRYKNAILYRKNYETILTHLRHEFNEKKKKSQGKNLRFRNIKKEFMFGLPHKERNQILCKSLYPIGNDDYNGKYFRRDVKPITNFEEACVFLFSKDNMDISDFIKIVKKHWRKKELGKLLSRYSKDEDDAKRIRDMTYRRQIEVFYQKLKEHEAMDYEKRDIEKDQLKNTRHIFIKLCNIAIPEELMFEILSYLKKGKFLLDKVGIVSEKFYIMCLKSWIEVKVSSKNMYSIPLIVLRKVKIIDLYTKTLYKDDYLYFIKHTKSVQVLRIKGNNAIKFFRYLEKEKAIKRNVRVLSVENLSNLSINKFSFPNIVWFSFNRFLVYENKFIKWRRERHKAMIKFNYKDTQFKRLTPELKEETRKFLEDVKYITFKSDEAVYYSREGGWIFPSFLLKMKGFKKIHIRMSEKYDRWSTKRQVPNSWIARIGECEYLEKILINDHSMKLLDYSNTHFLFTESCFRNKIITIETSIKFGSFRVKFKGVCTKYFMEINKSAMWKKLNLIIYINEVVDHCNYDKIKNYLEELLLNYKLIEKKKKIAPLSKYYIYLFEFNFVRREPFFF